MFECRECGELCLLSDESMYHHVCLNCETLRLCVMCGEFDCLGECEDEDEDEDE